MPEATPQQIELIRRAGDCVQMRFTGIAPSALNPWDDTSMPLLERLGQGDPLEALESIRSLRTEEALMDESVDSIVEFVSDRLRLVPRLAGDSIDDLARRFALNMLVRNLYTSHLVATKLATSDISQVVDLASFELILEAGSWGSAVVLPIHAGAIEAFVMVLSSLAPVTAVISQGSGVPDRPTPVQKERWPELDFNVVRAPSPSALLEAAAAAESGRILVIPPEFTSKHNDLVVDIDFQGMRVGVPSGYNEFARRLRLPMIPCHFRWDGSKYRLETAGPVAAHEQEGAIPRSVSRVFDLVNRALEDDVADWEGWFMLDRMILDSEFARSIGSAIA